MDSESKKAKCLRKILARNASVGCSSRIYYYRNSEGVPFKWEMKPGIAKDPPKEELPALSPPPALLSLGLPKPSIEEPKPSSSWSRLRFWKRNKESGESKNVHEKTQESSRDSVNGLDIGFECSSDSESMASPCNSSFSSSSSSSSSFTKQSRSSESGTREIYGRPLSCIPMHVSKILVSIARRD